MQDGMSDAMANLSPRERTVIQEEESWLTRARAAIEREHARAAEADVVDGHRSVAVLRELRDDARTTSEDDMPSLLHEMAVRQALIERGIKDLPSVDAPYFAHLAVREDDTTKDYLLGPTTLIDPKTGVRIVDWRVAPIARVFYRYREGDDYEEEFPGRVAEGTVVVRRLLVIHRGRLSRIVAGDVHVVRMDDDEWQSVLPEAGAFDASGAGAAARPASLGTGAGAAHLPANVDVTALLDAEQYAAVRAPLETPLVVLGSAGSGKTTVAFHRFARVAVKSDTGHVVVPEEGLARLWRRLLPATTAPGTVETLDEWAVGLARDVFGERLPVITGDTPGLVTAMKRHPALYSELAAHFRQVTPVGVTDKTKKETRGDGARKVSLEFRRLRKRLTELLSDRAFLERVVIRAEGALSRASVEETVRHTMHQLAPSFDNELRAIVVPELKRAVDGRRIVEDTPDELAGTIDVEDLPLVLWLHAALGGALPATTSHLALDEAEDFSSFDLDVLGKTLMEPRGITLAGDEAQQTSSCFPGWPASLSTLQVPLQDAVTVRLSVSYRCPEPVTAFAQQVLGPLASDEPPRAARRGGPVGRFRFPDAAQAALFIASSVAELLEREPRASVAVIAADAEAASRWFSLVSQHPGARVVLDGEFSFEPGLDVTHVGAVKGLEFDYVVLPDATAAAYPATDDARRRLHVAVTRAAHQLWVVSSGTESPILPALEASSPV
jgi:DNA helicase IV